MIFYPEINQILLLQEAILSMQKESINWIKDFQQLESVLQHIQNDDYYPNILDKSVHLFHSLIKFHIFNDWNKRTAIYVLMNFWIDNWLEVPNFLSKFEDVAVWTAKGILEKEDLKKLFMSIFASYDFDYKNVK